MKNNGGSAFSVPTEWNEEGMILRDYFAVKIMQYWLSLPMTKDQLDEVANESYKIADVMLNERNKS
jgi:hypothetical protein